ncbi:hypothetical protein JOE11_005029 [Robbsia andropogonis]|uniref:hypothetical protein n=1 Tax=Robbsia andropogonis TaxID=28092 RepID=UPI003D250E4F
MDTVALFARFDQAAASAERPKAAQLRDIFERVEALIRSGVRYATIIGILAEFGLTFSYNTFAVTLKRIRRQRRNLTSQSTQTQGNPRPSVNQTDAAPRPAQTVQSASAAAPISAATVQQRATIAPVGAKLPEDWLTATLTREQKRLLTPEQRSARADAVVKSLWPNPFDPVTPEKK